MARGLREKKTQQNGCWETTKYSLRLSRSTYVLSDTDSLKCESPEKQAYCWARLWWHITVPDHFVFLRYRGENQRNTFSSIDSPDEDIHTNSWTHHDPRTTKRNTKIQTLFYRYPAIAYLRTPELGSFRLGIWSQVHQEAKNQLARTSPWFDQSWQ